MQKALFSAFIIITYRLLSLAHPKNNTHIYNHTHKHKFKHSHTNTHSTYKHTHTNTHLHTPAHACSHTYFQQHVFISIFGEDKFWRDNPNFIQWKQLFLKFSRLLQFFELFCCKIFLVGKTPAYHRHKFPVCFY